MSDIIRLFVLSLLILLSACKTEQASVSGGETATTPEQQDLDSPPVASAVSAGLVLEDTQSGLITLPYTDPDGDRATSCEISQRSYVTVTTPCSCNSFGICRVRVTPILNYHGLASFKFSVRSNNVASLPALVTFTVFPVQDSPLAPDHSFTVLQNTTYTSGTVSPIRPNLPATDPDGGTLTCTRLTNPARGTLTVNSNCSFSYVPLANDVGEFFFTYQVSDGTLTSGTGRVDISLVRNNLPPVATASVVSAYQGVPVTFTLSATDPEGDALTYEISTPPSGTIQISGNQVTYTPVQNFLGSINLIFTAIDELGLSSSASVQINVGPGTYYLATTGNDSTATLNDPTKPFLTTQAVVDAAIAFAPTTIKPLVIEVGAGTFGNATVSTNFGTNITWGGVSHTASVIGNITARGTNGTDSTGVGDPLTGAWNGTDGQNGLRLTINSEFDTLSSRYTLSFGNIIVDGGNGGLHTPDLSFVPRPGIPGNGGIATLTGYFQSISATGGAGFAGGAGGQVTLKSDSTAVGIDASGGLDRCQLALSCATTVDGRDGGTVVIEARAVVSGSVGVNGGQSEGLAAVGRRTAGSGGTIRIAGTVSGTVSALGGNTYDSSVGEGGIVLIESTGIVTGQISTESGSTSNGGLGNAAGTVTVYGTAQDINVNSSPTLGGGAGRVDVYGTVRDIQAHHSSSSCGSGAAGIVFIRAGGVARNVYAYGGSGACVPSSSGTIDIYGTVTDTALVTGGNTASAATAPGTGGRVMIRATANVNDVSAAGGAAGAGTCLDGGDGGTMTIYPGATFTLGNLDVAGGLGDVGCGSSSGAAGTITNL